MLACIVHTTCTAPAPAAAPVTVTSLAGERTGTSVVFLPVQSKNAKDLSAGKLLVASRTLADPNFAKTVVLLVHHDAEGALGLIVNRRTDVPLSQVLEGLKGTKDRSDAVYLGGPVAPGAAFALLESTSKLEGAKHIFGGVYLVTNNLFEQTISARPDPDVFHVYLGYAGWTKDQLRQEVERGDWFIFPADAPTVFDPDPDSLWSKMIQKTELKLANSEPAIYSRPETIAIRYVTSTIDANACGDFPAAHRCTALANIAASASKVQRILESRPEIRQRQSR